MTEQYLSIVEVCRLLGVHRNSVEKWLRSGKLKGGRVGKLWRIPKSSLEEFMGVSQIRKSS